MYMITNETGIYLEKRYLILLIKMNNNQKKFIRFECLDSYRGLLAYLVIFDHSAVYYKLEYDYKVLFLIGEITF